MFFAVKMFDRQCLSKANSLSSDHDEIHGDIVLVDDKTLKNLPMNVDFNINNLFMSKNILVMAISMLAMRNNFQFRVRRSSKTRYSVTCINSDCSWKLNANICSDSKFWVIRTFVKVHSCFGKNIIHRHKQASASLISKCLKTDFSGCMTDMITP